MAPRLYTPIVLTPQYRVICLGWPLIKAGIWKGLGVSKERADVSCARGRPFVLATASTTTTTRSLGLESSLLPLPTSRSAPKRIFARSSVWWTSDWQVASLFFHFLNAALLSIARRSAILPFLLLLRFSCASVHACTPCLCPPACDRVASLFFLFLLTSPPPSRPSPTHPHHFFFFPGTKTAAAT